MSFISRISEEDTESSNNINKNVLNAETNVNNNNNTIVDDTIQNENENEALEANNEFINNFKEVASRIDLRIEKLKFNLMRSN